MRIISKKKLRNFWESHPDAEGPLRSWHQVASQADWKNFGDVRELYGHADQVGKYTVINIGGRKYRLIIHIHYNTSIIYVHAILTHEDYDAGAWKDG